MTAKGLSEIYVIGSGKISSSTSLFSKYLLLELIGSEEIQIPEKAKRFPGISLDLGIFPKWDL